MTFAEINTKLRDTADRFGGIKHYRQAADELDRTLSTFFKAQTVESLKALNGAYARVHRYSLETEVGGEKGPVAR